MIRIIFTIVIHVCMSGVASAQIEKGDWRVSAGIASETYSHVESDHGEYDRTGFSVSPQGMLRIGYAPLQIVNFGIDVSLSYDHIDGGEGYSDEDLLFVSVGPYVDLNFAMNSAKTILLGPSLSLRYTGFRSDRFSDGDGFQIVAGGEAKFFLVENASLDFGIFFAYSNEYGGDSFERFSIGPRLSISIWP